MENIIFITSFAVMEKEVFKKSHQNCSSGDVGEQFVKFKK